MTGHEWQWKTGGKDYDVRIAESKDGSGTLYIGDAATPFKVLDRHASSGSIEIAGRTFVYYLHRNRNEFSVWIGGRTYRLERVEKGRPADQASSSSGGEIRSTMPGKILSVEVKAGDTVAERQPVIVMESMKMENTLHAPRAGMVSEVRCKPGQTVDMGEVLLVIEVQQS